MKKLLKAFGLMWYSEFEASERIRNELLVDGLNLKACNEALERKLEIQAEQHKKIEEIKIAQVNLSISSENDRLRTRLAEVVGELSDIQHRYSVAKLELEKVQVEIDLIAENAELRQRLAEIEAHHKRTESGVKTLVTFIHRTHRLNLPFQNGTIRAALNKANGS